MDPTKFRAFMARASEQVESFWPATLELDGKDYPGTGGGLKREASLNDESGGLETGASIQMRVSKLLLGVPPCEGAVVFYSGKSVDEGADNPRIECIVDAVTERDWDVSWGITLMVI